MPKDSEQRADDLGRVVAITQLKELAAAFVINPLEPKAICAWYIGFGEHYPLWALQEREYRTLIQTPSNKLVLDHAWRVMLAKSEVQSKEFADDDHHLTWTFPVIDMERRGDVWEAVVQPPLSFAARTLLPGYLLHTYREALLRRGDEQFLRNSLKPGFFRLPLRSKDETGYWDPDDPYAIPTEFQEALDLIATLRELVVERDLASEKPVRYRMSAVASGGTVLSEVRAGTISARRTRLVGLRG